MRAGRFAGAIVMVAAVIEVYRLVAVNNTTVELSLVLAILGI